MATAPDADMVALLVAQGQGTSGTTIFASTPRGVAAGVPDAALFVSIEPGDQPQPMTGGAATRAQAHSRVRIWTRGAPDDRAGALAAARAARDAVNRQRPTGYVNIIPEGDEPTDAGKDRAERWVFYQFFSMWHVRD